MRDKKLLVLVAVGILISALFYIGSQSSAEFGLDSAFDEIEGIYGAEFGEDLWEIWTVKIADINLDGLTEIATYKANCSAWNCDGIRIFQMRGDEVVEIGPDNPNPRGYFDSRAPRELKDLNGDGKDEILSLYTKFPPFPCNQCRPHGHFIYEWRDGRYEDVTDEFSWYYEEKIVDKKDQIDGYRRSNSLAKMAFEGLHIVFWYKLIGRANEGLRWYRETIDTETVRNSWEQAKDYIPPPDGIRTRSIDEHLEYAKMIADTDLALR